jgi:transcription antitermination factor NusG
MGWYVVETNPIQEEIAEGSINDLGIKTLLLKEPRIRRSHHRFARPYVLSFPGYLFAEFDLSQDRFAWPAIPRQRGVRTILGMTSQHAFPTAIRPQDCERIQELAIELKTRIVEGSATPKPLPPETVIQILWGPWQGITGKIEIDNGIRADVLLASAGMFGKVNVPRELIQAL